MRFARSVSRDRDGWPTVTTVHKTPEQLMVIADPESAGMPTFPRSSLHPNRSHWPKPWRLAEYGTHGVGGRLLWNADHPDHRHDGKEWVCHVDLNTGEFKVPFQPWQRIDEGSGQQSVLSDQSITLALVSPLSSLVGFPEPHDGMTADERRGWRPSGFGAAPGETLQEFYAWKKRLDEFFEQKTSKGTKGAGV